MHHSQSTILDLDPVPQKHRRKRRGDGADGDQRSAVIPMAYSTALHSVGVELVLHLVLQLYSGQRGSGFSRYDLVRRKAALEKSPGRKPGRQPTHVADVLVEGGKRVLVVALTGLVAVLERGDGAV
jgi:hypothetical protein